MFFKFHNKPVNISLSISIILIILITVIYMFIVSMKPSYEGSDVKLSKADEKSSTLINNAVLFSIPPDVKSGEQAIIQITKYTGAHAQGTVSYDQKKSKQQFMAVKSENKWDIIVHNTGNQLNLPDIKTAQLYNLPKGWYKT